MTKKDYIAIASAFDHIKPNPDQVMANTGSTHPDAIAGDMDAWRNVVHAIAEVLERDNPRFDRKRFISACEGE